MSQFSLFIEIDANLEVTYTIQGRHIPSTLTDPEEFPELYIENIMCEIYGHTFELTNPPESLLNTIEEAIWEEENDR